MDSIALFFNDIYIYWHGVCMAGALLTGIAAALLLCVTLQRHRTQQLLNALLLALPLGLLFSRLFYCLNNYETAGNVWYFTEGGYALYGAILGVAFAVLLLRLCSRDFALGAVCDCLAAGGSLSVALGKMTSCLSHDNIGIEITDPAFQFYPLALFSEEKNTWELATFNGEAVIGLLIFVVLCFHFVRNNNEKKQMRGRHGDIALLFLMLHGASQALFDSMHFDALKLPFNKFIRIQQVIGAVCLAVFVAVFVIRSARMHGLKFRHFAVSIGCLSMIGLSLYMMLDRISNTNYVGHHCVIFAAMLCASAMGLFIYGTTLTRPSRQ